MFQILLLLGSFLVHNIASLAAPLVKGSCKPTCGDVPIPFPFGIGIGCFLDDWYEIVCQESSHGSIPILNKTTLRVSQISLPDYHGGANGMIIVNLPIIFSPNGTCGRNRSSTPVSLKGSHFVFSESMNFFAAVGCNVCALLDDTKSAIIGCKSICEKDENAMSKKHCSGSDGCCHTTITSDLQAFNVTFRAENKTAETKCEYAFLGDRSQFPPSTTDFNKLKASGHFPAVLDWGIDPSSKTPLEIYQNGSTSGDSYNCSNLSFNLAYRKEMPFLQCSCNKGFTGNPYIKDGCQDVDECQDAHDRCPGRNCVNRRGSFRCVEKTVKFLLIGVGAGLGALLMFLLLWLLYNFMKKRKEIKLKERYFKQNGGLLLRQQLRSSDNNVEKSKLFSAKDLEKATDSFNKNRILGEGGQGTVYKGMLADGGIVAIKRSKAIDKGKVEQFICKKKLITKNLCYEQEGRT